MALQVKKINLADKNSLIAEFTNGHTMVFHRIGRGDWNAPEMIYLETGQEVVVRYRPKHSAANKAVELTGFTMCAKDYPVGLFIDYIRATIEAARQKHFDIWKEARKAEKEIPLLQQIA